MIEKNQTVTACRERWGKKGEILPPFYFIILLNVRVRYHKEKIVKEKEEKNLTSLQQTAADSHLDFTHKIFPTFPKSLFPNYNTPRKESAFIVKYLFDSIYCSSFFCSYYLCNSFFLYTSCEGMKAVLYWIPCEIHLDSAWLHHLTFISDLPNCYICVVHGVLSQFLSI